jgi:ABC-2 type transport system permease protein
MNVDIVRPDTKLQAQYAAQKPRRLGPFAYLACFRGIVWREVLRFLHQRERFFSALVRPLVWLFIFAAGFRQVLGVSIIPPYESYVLYETFVTPGLVGMILLFNAMQSSLSMVYDRETGAMRTLLVSPFPRSFLLLSKLIGGVAVALLQAYAFLAIAYFWEIEPPMIGYLTVLPALILAGLMLGSLSLFISSVIKQLENFAGVMNFVIFPMFFASSALYPLWRIRESSPLLYEICRINPFTYAVELIRFALYGQIGPRLEDGSLDLTNLYVVLAYTVFFLGAAIYAYNPSKGLIGRRGGPGGGA